MVFAEGSDSDSDSGDSGSDSGDSDSDSGDSRSESDSASLLEASLEASTEGTSDATTEGTTEDSSRSGGGGEDGGGSGMMSSSELTVLTMVGTVQGTSEGPRVSSEGSDSGSDSSGGSSEGSSRSGSLGNIEPSYLMAGLFVVGGLITTGVALTQHGVISEKVEETAERVASHLNLHHTLVQRDIMFGTGPFVAEWALAFDVPAESMTDFPARFGRSDARRTLLDLLEQPFTADSATRFTMVLGTFLEAEFGPLDEAERLRAVYFPG